MSSPEPEHTVITASLSHFIATVLLDQWGIPGLALSVVRPDGALEMQGFGVMDDAGQAVTPDTLFGIASCSKAFSAFATCVLMHDYERGALPASYKPLPGGLRTFDWHTPVKTLWPGFELQDKAAEQGMRMWDLVAHTSGLPTHDIAYGAGEERDEVLKRLKYMKPNRGLREEWQYNNLMFMTNARIIEDLSGTPYTQFVTERILQPLQMHHSTYSPAEAAALGPFSQAFCWVRGEGGTKVVRAEKHFVDEETVGLMAAGGGVISTARDMTNWLRCLLGKGVNPHTGERMVSEHAFRFMTTGHVVGGFHLAHNPAYAETSATLYAGGLFVNSYQGHELVYHTGGTPGISAYQVFLPNDGLAFAILTNLGSRQTALLALIHRIVEDVLGLPRIDWNARFRAAEAKAAAAARERAKSKARPADAALPLPLAAYGGRYESRSYGALTLYSAASPASAERDALLSAFRTTDASPSAPSLLAPDVPQLYAALPRIWGSHVRLQHRAGDAWAARLEQLYPRGWGRDGTPFVRAGEAFDVGFEREGEGQGQGGGRVRGFWMVRYSLAQPVREGDYERAKQWFDKVE